MRISFRNGHVVRATIASLVTDVPAQPDGQTTGFGVSPVTPQLLDPWFRLLALLDTPEDVPVLAPMLEREILNRLLRGPEAAFFVRSPAMTAGCRRSGNRSRGYGRISTKRFASRRLQKMPG